MLWVLEGERVCRCCCSGARVRQSKRKILVVLVVVGVVVVVVVVALEEPASAAVAVLDTDTVTLAGGSWERSGLYGGPPQRRIWFSAGTPVKLTKAASQATNVGEKGKARYIVSKTRQQGKARQSKTHKSNASRTSETRTRVGSAADLGGRGM